MPTKKINNRRGKLNKRGGGDGDDNDLGSAPRSSEGMKPMSNTSATASPATASPANASPANASFFQSSKARLLSVPATAASAATAVAATIKPQVSSGSMVFRYLLVLFVLCFLGLTLYLYLEKPKNASIMKLYDPVYKFFGNLEKKKQNSAINKLEKILDDKKVVNNIDNKGASTVGKTVETSVAAEEKKYKKKPVIPQADDATSQTQMKPKSKAGFCYIGEDRGFRSCIEVGEGDICMSGDIFPTQAICINPNLRE